MYAIELSAAARRALRQGLPRGVATAVVEALTGPIARNPHTAGGELDESFLGCRSARRGDYRIVYTVDDEGRVVRVVRIRHRRDAYRR